MLLGPKPPKPIPIECPLCHEVLGGLLLHPANLRAVQIEVECDIVEGRIGHRELRIVSLDIAKQELPQAVRGEPEDAERLERPTN